MEMRKVFSTNVSALGYDASSKELHVAYNSGKTAVYQDVPPQVAQSVIDAPSIGTALNREIKGRYAFGYLADGQK